MEGTACCDNGKNGCYSGCQQLMADRKSVKFWEYVAKRYRNRMDVWFELYNEPAYPCAQNLKQIPTGQHAETGVGGNLDALINGGKGMQTSYKNGCPPSPAATFDFVGYQELYNAVRHSAGSDNIVLVGGTSWAYSWQGLLVPPNGTGCSAAVGPEGVDLMVRESPRGEGYPAPVGWSSARWGRNVLYNTHPYQSKTGLRPTPGTACGDFVPKAAAGTVADGCTEMAGWDRAFGYLADYVPVIATEFGPAFGDPCDGTFVTCQMKWMKDKMISMTPWAYWGNPAAQCNNFPTLVNPDWSVNAYGKAVKEFEAKNPSP